jgi:hypothetical protein
MTERRGVRRSSWLLGGAGVLVAALLAGGAPAGTAPAVLEVGRFSAETPGDGPPVDWKPLTFKKIERHTRYRLVPLDGDVVVEAVSTAGASGLTREIRIDPHEFPIVEWRWRVSNLLTKGDPTRKDGDDYPARLYITFAYDPGRLGFPDKAKYATAKLLYGTYPPHAGINYIWEGRVPKDTILPNAYTDRVRMVVVESGPGRLQQWVRVERNIVEDYRRAFGEEPPMISGVAIMTDTDNTGESVTAHYGDIRFRR